MAWAPPDERVTLVLQETISSARALALAAFNDQCRRIEREQNAKRAFGGPVLMRCGLAADEALKTFRRKLVADLLSRLDALCAGSPPPEALAWLSATVKLQIDELVTAIAAAIDDLKSGGGIKDAAARLGRTAIAVRRDVDIEIEQSRIALPPGDVKHLPIGLKTHRFEVALSYPGDVRWFVSDVASHLERLLGAHRCFYDKNYEPWLAQPDLDLLLQDIYRHRSRLVVVFLGEAYERKDWCAGAEFRAIRESIRQREAERIMFVRMDSGAVRGVFNIDGAIDATLYSPPAIAEMVKQRLDSMPQSHDP